MARAWVITGFAVLAWVIVLGLGGIVYAVLW
jgi:hypothetical protein